MESSGAGQVTATQVPASNPPDWDNIQELITCPLCEYNLRGLTEPRCPECGYRFEWAVLLNPNDRVHPWLFEHRKARKVRAMLHTLLMSQLPWRFWRSIRPIHQVRVRRVLLYWLVLSTLFGLVALGVRSSGVIDYYIARRQFRLLIEREFNGPNAASLQRRYGSADALLKQKYPLVLSTDALKRLWERPKGALPQTAMAIYIGALLWPWLTLVTLLIFQQSMRRAQINKAHVLRCAIYSTDLSTLLSIPVAWLMIYSQTWLNGANRNYLGTFFPAVALVFPAVLAALVIWKLTWAYRHYLCFPHAIWVTVSSQIIVLLILIFLAPWSWTY